MNDIIYSMRIRLDPSQSYQIVNNVLISGDLFFVFHVGDLQARLDDSDVVFMGDEECCVVDVTPQKINFVEIDD